MTTIFTLSLTATLIVLLLYPVFNLLVSRCRAFQFNRILILVGMAIAVLTPILLPLFSIPTELSSISSTDEVSTDAVSGEATVQPVAPVNGYSSGNLIALIICLYWLGVGALIIREVVAYIRLAHIVCKSEKTRTGGYTICKPGDKCLAPFSWGKYIVVADGEIEETILIHEKTHSSRRHWIDIAVARVFCIYLWYNPCAWMLKNLMKLNHEYEADAKVIESDIDILDYQRLLIAKAIGNRSLPLANNFPLKRIWVVSGNFQEKVKFSVEFIFILA